MKPLLILCLAAAALAQNPPPAIMVGTDVPQANLCQALQVGNIYVRSESPANGPINVSRCTQTGSLSYAWQPVGHFSGNPLPSKCSIGDVAFDTGATAGQNLYGCTSTNTWTAQGGGGGGGTGTSVFSPSSASGTAYSGTATPTVTLSAGATLLFTPDVNCTAGAVTLNVDGTGATALKQADGSTNPAAADCPSGKAIPVVYNGTVWVLPTSPTSGTGSFVRSTSPTLTTPTLGVATATSLNRLTLTAPATGSTLTLIDGKTFTVNKTLTIDGTDGTTMTFPTTSATIARTDSANTFTGHQTIEGVTATGATGTGAMVYSISPAFTVSPTAPTQTAADNSTKLATTAYVDAAAAAATPKWSSLTAPTGNLSLSFGANSTTFTFNAATGSINGIKLTDTLNNTGSGILAYATTASGSSMLPWQGDANGVGFKIHTDGSLKSVGATTDGSVILSGITSGSCTLSVADTAVAVTNTCGSSAKYIQGNSAQPAVNAGSCTGATIGTGATNTAGTITGLPSGTCSVVLTFASATAATGWSCGVSDQTTANLFRQTASSTTTATLAGTSVSGDVLVYVCAAY